MATIKIIKTINKKTWKTQKTGIRKDNNNK